ncbi:hypothetical protein NKG94_14530 [Micromonospora sp. M12]
MSPDGQPADPDFYGRGITYDGWAWLDCYQLGPSGDAVARRSLFIQPARVQYVPPALFPGCPARTRPAGLLGGSPAGAVGVAGEPPGAQRGCCDRTATDDAAASAR